MEPSERDMLLMTAWNQAAANQDCDAMQAIYDEVENEAHKGILHNALQAACS